MRARLRSERTVAALAAAGVLSCSASPPPPGDPPPDPPPPAAATADASEAPRVLTLLSLNDLHGRMEALPLFAAYVANVRALRAQGGGGVLVLDGGDMFQGTLESNLGEGIGVVEAYAQIRFDAVAIGNHEFDFGPVWPRSTQGPGDDPRGALLAAAARAPFPFLLANVLERGGRRWAGPNVAPTTLVEVAGARVGIVGLTTADLLHTTIAANVADLAVVPLADTIVREAAALRARGASVVVAVAHAGGKCPRFGGAPEADGCEMTGEAFEVLRALPAGTIDAFVGGHTHQGVAHLAHGVPFIEAFAYGTHFGRVDLELVGSPGRVRGRTVHPPTELCPGVPKDPDWASCRVATYEDRALVRDPAVAAAIAPHLARAADRKAQRVGVTLSGVVRRAYDRESALGNLFADLLREARPDAAVVLMNGGGLRADLPGGDLRYEDLFEAFPFDNRVSLAKVTGRRLAEILAHNLQRAGGILSISGATVTARCEGGALVVEITRGGRRLGDDEVLTILASDFLMTGGDAFWGSLPPPPVIEEDGLIRDELERALARRGSIDVGGLLDARRPRLRFPGSRPVVCR